MTNSRLTEKHYLTALSSFVPFGPQRIKLLRKYFGSAKKTWNESKKELIEVGLRRKTVDEFIEYRTNFDLEKYFNKMKKLGIKTICIDDENYPSNLLDLDNAPIVLYVMGDIEKTDVSAVAIVGTRKMTSYGREVAQKFSQELASYGVTIVSGLAMGVDTEAHKGALGVKGRTIAVTGSGLDVIYPPMNIGLAKKISEGNGAVVSEYPLSYPALRNNFANRNRIISGLSKAVIVIEGMQKSGTLLTATHAAEQGRTVFAVPGQITSPMSGAPHFLIKNGAKMVTGVQDILEELDLQLKVDREAVDKVMPSDETEKKLLDILESEPFHLDEIARILKIDVSLVSSKLTMMELKGLVKNLGGGVYRITS